MLIGIMRERGELDAEWHDRSKWSLDPNTP